MSLSSTEQFFPITAAWCSELRWAALGTDIQKSAIRAVLDTLGVGLAGASRPLVQQVVGLMATESAPGPCSVLGKPGGLRPLAAAMANGTACHVLDYDDTCYDGIVHASCVVLPAVLACAEESNASGEELMTAFVAGSEITYLLGRVLPDIFWQGWWTTSLLGAIGAAAGSARALGCDADQTAQAMAIASCFTFGLRTVLGTDATPLGAGYAAEAGVRAALLARTGAKGPVEGFSSVLGVARMFNQGRIDALAMGSLGKVYGLSRERIARKRYPACSGMQAATQAVDELLVAHAVSADQVAEVRCRVTPLVAESLRYPRPVSLTQAQFSLPFAIGCRLRFGSFGVQELTDGVLADAGLAAEMAKVVMTRDDDLVGPDDLARYPEAAEVTLRLHDGRTLQRFVGAALGMPDAPMDDDQLNRKFIACSGLPAAAARRLVSKVRDLPSLGSARELLASTGRAR